MSIADNIREAVAHGRLHMLQDRSTVENQVLTAFMRKGDYFDHTAHALDFALLVACALDTPAPNPWDARLKAASGVMASDGPRCPSCNKPRREPGLCYRCAHGVKEVPDGR